MTTTKKTRTRAWDLRPGDVLSPIGYTIQHVTIDDAGRGGRMVHITHELGVMDVPINQFVTIQDQRETSLWD